MLLKTHLRTDYRKVSSHPKARQDLVMKLEFKRAPSKSQIQRCIGLFPERCVKRFNALVLEELKKRGRPPRSNHGVDSSGLQEHHRSSHLNNRTRKNVRRRDFRKLHLAVETSQPVKVIYESSLPSGRTEDSPQFIPLLEHVPRVIGEVSWDIAYSSRKNAQYVADRGGRPFPALKDNVRALAFGHPPWRGMVLRYWNHPRFFDRHYHRRSNTEAQNCIWKKWCGEALDSRKRWNQRREVQWKNLAINLRLLVRYNIRREITTGG